VKVYSNAKEVELLLNGISQGKPADATNGVFVWNEIPLQPGPNRVAARAQIDGRAMHDECVWMLKVFGNGQN
jgi:hypothetical protein